MVVDDDGNNSSEVDVVSAATRSVVARVENSAYWWGDKSNESNDNSNSGSSEIYNYYSWFQHPGTILFLSSVPLCVGAWIGYKIPTDRVEDFVLRQGSRRTTGTTTTRRRNKTKRTATDVGNKNDASSSSNSSSSSKISTNTKNKNNNNNGGKMVMKRKQKRSKAMIKEIAGQTASRALRIATMGTVGTFGFIGAMAFYWSGYDTMEDAVIGTKRRASLWNEALEMLFGSDRSTSKTHPEVLATKHMNENEELNYLYEKYIRDEVVDATTTTDGDDNNDNIRQQNNEEGEAEYPTPQPTLLMIYQKYFPASEKEP